jgi:hypothetical protein
VPGWASGEVCTDSTATRRGLFNLEVKGETSSRGRSLFRTPPSLQYCPRRPDAAGHADVSRAAAPATRSGDP